MKAKKSNPFVPFFPEIPETSLVPETSSEMPIPSIPDDLATVDDSSIPELPFVRDDPDDEWAVLEEIPSIEHSSGGVDTVRSISHSSEEKWENRDGVATEKQIFSEHKGKAYFELIVWKTNNAFSGFLLADGKDLLTYYGGKFGEFFQPTDSEVTDFARVPMLSDRDDSEPIDPHSILKHFRRVFKNIPTDIRDYVLSKIKEYGIINEHRLLNLVKKRLTNRQSKITLELAEPLIPKSEQHKRERANTEVLPGDSMSVDEILDREG